MVTQNWTTPQQRAVTRRKVPSGNLADVVYAELPYYRQGVQQQRAYEQGLRELAQQQEQAQRAEALQREQLEANRKQGMISSGISGLGTLATAGKAAYDMGLLGGGAAGTGGLLAGPTLSGLGEAAGVAGITDAVLGGGAGAAGAAGAGAGAAGAAAGYAGATSGAFGGAAGGTLFGGGGAGMGAMAALGVAGAAIGVGVLYGTLMNKLLSSRKTPGGITQINAAREGLFWDKGSESWVKGDLNDPERQAWLRYLMEHDVGNADYGYKSPQESDAKFRWAMQSQGWDPDTYAYTGVIPEDLGPDPYDAIWVSPGATG